MDDQHSVPGRRDPAAQVTTRLREEFARLGMSREDVLRLIPRRDLGGREYVYIGTVPLAFAERLVDALVRVRADDDTEAAS